MRPAPHYQSPALHELLGLASDRAALRAWASRMKLESLDGLLDAELMQAPMNKLERWSALLTALRRLRVVAQEQPAALPQQLRQSLGLGPDHPLSPALLAAFHAPYEAAPDLTPREGLQRLGGIASARAIADRIAPVGGAAPSVREVRDRLRNAGDRLRKLGAGYYALSDRRAEPVQTWAEARLRHLHREPVTGFCRAMLSSYPHGDIRAISAWLHQARGPIVLRRNAVCYEPPREV